jgi:Rrf2 family protein
MLFTRETDYALRFFRTLQDGKQYPVGEIAEREMIPQQFAYKILRKLSKAGYVDVTRGAKGGCRLAVEPASVSLLELVQTIETKKAFVPCLDPNYSCEYRDSHGGCRVHENMNSVEDKLKMGLADISIDDILNKDMEGEKL